MTAIKICGVTRPEDAARAAALGVDYLGLNFWPRSKRYLAPARAAEVAAAGRGAQIVGVFVDPSLDDVIAACRAAALDVIQLHGHESPADVAAVAGATGRPVWKALAADRAGDAARYEVDAILLDTPSVGRGGSGATFDWALARDVVVRRPRTPILLAGGLTADNVATAIAAVGSWGVDVASGVEASPGIKDPDKLAAFVAAARAR